MDVVHGRKRSLGRDIIWGEFERVDEPEGPDWGLHTSAQQYQLNNTRERQLKGTSFLQNDTGSSVFSPASMSGPNTAFFSRKSYRTHS